MMNGVNALYEGSVRRRLPSRLSPMRRFLVLVDAGLAVAAEVAADVEAVSAAAGSVAVVVVAVAVVESVAVVDVAMLHHLILYLCCESATYYTTYLLAYQWKHFRKQPQFAPSYASV